MIVLPSHCRDRERKYDDCKDDLENAKDYRDEFGHVNLGWVYAEGVHAAFEVEICCVIVSCRRTIKVTTY